MNDQYRGPQDHPSPQSGFPQGSPPQGPQYMQQGQYGSTATMAPPPKRKRTWLIVLVIVGVVLIALIGGCAAIVGTAVKSVSEGVPSTQISVTSQPSVSLGPVAEPTEEATEEPADEPTEEATEEPADEPTEEPTEDPEPEPATLTFKGRGNDVVKLKKTLSDAMLVTTTWTGSDDNNTIFSIDEDGNEGDLLVNTIGSYKGTNLINVNDDDTVRAFKVEGSGSWKIVLEPLSKATAWDGKGAFKGDSDDIVNISGAFDGFDSLRFKSTKADSNVTVYGLGENGEDLIVNDIGNFSGEYVVPNETYLLRISSDGNWEMKKD